MLDHLKQRKIKNQQKYDNLFDISKEFRKFDLERYNWAKYTVTSRTFRLKINKKDTKTMIPYAGKYI